MPRLVTKMLAGLMSRWTMPARCAASSASAISMPSVEESFEFERAAGDDVLERRAIEKFHGDEGAAVVFADVVDGADVGMVQRGGGAGFALEAFERLRDRARRSSGRNLSATKRPRRVSSAL